jgi:hypothetical protein
MVATGPSSTLDIGEKEKSYLSNLLSMWTIQESLLQQYRSMAITLLGLLSAGILVIIANFIDNWDKIGGIFYGDKPKLSIIVTILAIILYVILLVLGITGTMKFKSITTQRAIFVTFYQNLTIAFEANTLRAIAERHSIPYPPPILHLQRLIIERKGIEPLRYEMDLRKNAEGFIAEILEKGGRNEDWRIRHYTVRNFLSGFIYSVFTAFFIISSLIVLAIIFRLFGW